MRRGRSSGRWGKTARALDALTRTLRELNALLAQHAPRAASEYDDMPEDIDAFRERLARRIEAFMELRRDDEDAFTPDDEDQPARRDAGRELTATRQATGTPAAVRETAAWTHR